MGMTVTTNQTSLFFEIFLIFSNLIFYKSLLVGNLVIFNFYKIDENL